MTDMKAMIDDKHQTDPRCCNTAYLLKWLSSAEASP